MRLMKHADGVLKYADVSRIADVLKKLADVLKKLADVRQLMLADVRNLQIADVMIFCLDSCSLEISDILANVLARYQPNFHPPVTKPSQPYCPFIFYFNTYF